MAGQYGFSVVCVHLIRSAIRTVTDLGEMKEIYREEKYFWRRTQLALQSFLGKSQLPRKTRLSNMEYIKI